MKGRDKAGVWAALWLCFTFLQSLKKNDKKRSKEKNYARRLPLPAPYYSRIFSVVFFPAFKASSQKSSLKGIRPHARRSLPIIKWWEVEKLIFSLACIRRGVRVREQATHANVAIDIEALYCG